MEGFTVLILPEVKDLVERKETAELRETLRCLHPADVADLLVNLDGETAGAVFEAMDGEERIQTFEFVPEADQVRMLDVLGQQKMAGVVEGMSSDDRARFLKALPQATVDAMLPLLAQAERNEVVKLMSFTEGTAGSIMTTEYVSFLEEVTIADALTQIRKVAPLREMVHYVYVTDAHHHLHGVISLRQLIMARPDQKVVEIANRNVIRVPVEADREEVAQTLKKYDFLALPITDRDNRLLGIVTHDDVLDVVIAEATEDAQRMGAVAPMKESYFQASLVRVVRSRLTWLVLLFLGGTLTGTVLRHFEADLKTVVALSIFIPLLIGTGGNAGSQTVTTVVRALALGEVGITDVLRVLKREFTAGLMLGVLLGSIMIGRALMWDVGWHLALAVAVSVVAVCVWATTVGAVVPIMCQRLRIDPTVVSAPLITTLVDATGLFIYFSIARVML